MFSEEIEHIDPGPVEAVTATGANLIQTIRFAVIPQIIPSFLAYSLLRWDINMRSATVIGFVAGGGIGFFVIETVRMGGYQQYATALWAVAIVIIIVDYISASWRAQYPAGSAESGCARHAAGAAHACARIVYVDPGRGRLCLLLGYHRARASAACSSPGKNFGRLILDFLKIDLTPEILKVVFQQMLVTIFQAMLATTLGALVAFPFSFLAAKNLTGRSRLLIWLYYAARAPVTSCARSKRCCMW